ncbi:MULTISPECIES: cell wall elongation regulator TseB-like domain-containing protein [Bacillus]|uniref:cell wall elongation regulator TseB-like domain-containing protein n=1 Tax=Bacillus TaxID=1386 RepID=UPI0002DEF4C0|nr:MULTISPECIES: DUF5590 domain-containing protein [Bacillus]
MKKWILAISFLLIIIIGYVIASFLVGMDYANNEEERAINIAKSEGGLTTVSDFYLYHGKEVYSVVVGKDKKGVQQVLWIPKDRKDHSIVKKKYSSGVSKKEITKIVEHSYQPDEIISIKLGMESKVALWEVTIKDHKDRLHYYYFDFLTGESLTKYIGI